MRPNYLFLTLILFIVSLLSCTSPRLTQVFYNDNTNTYKITVPKGYEREIVETGGEYVEYRYKYPDRSVIYVTSEYPGPSGINYNRVHRMRDLYYKRNNIADSLRPDTLTIGACLDGLCWKDKKIGNRLSIGYAKVPHDKKALYDRALESIELHGKKTIETSK